MPNERQSFGRDTVNRDGVGTGLAGVPERDVCLSTQRLTHLKFDLVLLFTRFVKERMALTKLQTQDTTGMAQTNADRELSQTEVHEVLSNRRRQLTLQYLAQSGGSMKVRELSEEIAVEFSGERPPPRDLRASVYSTLHQTHLPKLSELHVIDYELNNKSAELGKNFSDVKTYMNIETSYGVTWADVYFFLSIGGLVTVLAAEVGVPVISNPGPLVWILLSLALLIGTRLYRASQMYVIPS